MIVETLTNSGTATELNLGRTKLDGTGLKGVIAVDRGDTDVTLCGSLDGTTYFVIETFSADTMKEITLVPYFKVNGAADTTMDDDIGSSTVKLFFSKESQRNN